MKFFKWILILFVAVFLIFFLALEAYYFYTVSKLDLKKVVPKSSYSQEVYDTVWVSVGETGEVELERTSATKFVIGRLNFMFSGRPIDHSQLLSKGFRASEAVARLKILNKRQRSLERHISRAAASIWLSRHSQVNDLLGYLIEESYFGVNLFGIEAASNFYFKKKTNELNLSEIVSLVSLLKSPTKYSHPCNSQRLKARADFVHSQLQKNWPNRYGNHEFHFVQVAEGEDRECK